MSEKKRSRPKWVWAAAMGLTLSLTGCGMYPSAPGKWPHSFWGSILHGVSNIIDYFAHYMGYGLALIVLTVIVRLIILPLMIRQIRFSKSMQLLQPKINEIRKKYKGDNQKIQQETMKVYQEHGFNPMSGCLPMIVQLPVLYALFGAIEGNVKLHQATFLGIFHLGQHDHTFILPILAGVTTYMSSRVMMAGQDTQQKMMLYIMPVFVFFMATRFASGLALYWVTSNLFMAVQSYFIRVRPAKAGAGGTAATANAIASGGGTSPSGHIGKGQRAAMRREALSEAEDKVEEEPQTAAETPAVGGSAGRSSGSGGPAAASTRKRRSQPRGGASASGVRTGSSGSSKSGSSSASGKSGKKRKRRSAPSGAGGAAGRQAESGNQAASGAGTEASVPADRTDSGPAGPGSGNKASSGNDSAGSAPTDGEEER